MSKQTLSWSSQMTISIILMQIIIWKFLPSPYIDIILLCLCWQVIIVNFIPIVHCSICTRSYVNIIVSNTNIKIAALLYYIISTVNGCTIPGCVFKTLFVIVKSCQTVTHFYVQIFRNNTFIIFSQ